MTIDNELIDDLLKDYKKPDTGFYLERYLRMRSLFLNLVGAVESALIRAAMSAQTLAAYVEKEFKSGPV